MVFDRLRENLLDKRAAIPTLIALGVLSVGGCASAPEKTPAVQDATEQTVGNEGDFEVAREFTPSGKMISTVDTDNSGYPNDKTLSYCQGRDLIDVSYWTDADNFLRTPDHSACDDGMLTAADFPAAGR